MATGVEELVDIWLPDCKYRSAKLSSRYSRAADYPETVEAALAEMVRQTGAPLFGRRGMMKKGVIVRHLVLPGCVSDSKDVLEYLWDTFGNQIYVSIMSQYTPLPHVAAGRPVPYSGGIGGAGPVPCLPDVPSAHP